MKLKIARIREFKSIWDSNEFSIGDVTCLVGKNESGKTAVLEALYRLNPIRPEDGRFDITDDYPRAEVENYRQDVESGRREHAVIIEAHFELEQQELEAIENDLGAGVLERAEVVTFKSYENEGQEYSFSVPVVESRIVENLVTSSKAPPEVATAAAAATSLKELVVILSELAETQKQAAAAATKSAAAIEDDSERAEATERAKSLHESEQAKTLRAKAEELAKKDLEIFIWEKYLEGAFPLFLYFNEYYQMRGHENIAALKSRQQAGKLRRSDHPMLGLIELARLDLDDLLQMKRTQELKNKLQGASNYLSTQVLKYWSQNKHLRMMFDARPGLSEDPEEMRQGMNIWGDVYDSRHDVSTSLGTRSAGFVWFFSFLAWYSSEKKQKRPLVLLLDEPGLSLHGKAQEDLLRYFEAEVAPNPLHQLIYTTHSPFMVDPERFDRVRIIQDQGIDSETPLPRAQDGTKVLTDVLDAGADSLFPLQGALGYEIYQTLFIGPNSLVVEGVSDLLYLQTVSGMLSTSGRTSLDPRWTITPVGGADKVPTFVALLGAQRKLNVAVLIDFQKSDQQSIENMYKRKLLDKSHVLTFVDFTQRTEADIEDMFSEAEFLSLLSSEFGVSVKPADLPKDGRRILLRLDEWLAQNPLPNGVRFNHYRPARLLAETSAKVKLSATTLKRFETMFAKVNALLE